MNENLERYKSFVRARHGVWVKRDLGLPAPWTDDPIVATRKFTNVFRILDRGSQFVLTDLLDPELSVRDQLARLFLYRHTGRVETWKFLEMICGYPTADTLDDTFEAWKQYRGVGVAKLLNKKPRSERSGPGKSPSGGFQSTTYEHPMFTGAYLVFPQSQIPGTDKLASIIDLTKRLFTEGSPQDLIPHFSAAETQAGRFASLCNSKGVANFMSMQILTDWGYSEPVDRENEFIVAGPGAIKGSRAIDSRVPADAMIRGLKQYWDDEGDVNLYGRPPSLMDVQNTLCEFSKYVRLSPGRENYKPVGSQQDPILPDHYTESLI